MSWRGVRVGVEHARVGVEHALQYDGSCRVYNYVGHGRGVCVVNGLVFGWV